MSFQPINCYAGLPKSYQAKTSKYRSYDKIKIDLPTRALICGAGGSGKSNILLNFILGINAWDDIWLLVKCERESLYAYLTDEIRKVEEKLGVEILHVITSIDELPEVDSFDPKLAHLLVIDDMVNEKESKLQVISDYWVRGRKQNITSVFLSQSYFHTPKLIRLNTNIFIFKELKKMDCKRIMATLAMAIEPDEMFEMYKRCNTSDISSFFLIDVGYHEDKRLMFRHNFDPLVRNE